ncbi:hypothetical protein C0991_000957 [Blastosporella zonata]|nr:hypothetical protein C0991_000957 [Blastosporella zonata]
MAFNLVQVDVEKNLMVNKTNFQLSNIYNNPNHERVLITAIKNQCHTSKNAPQEMLRDSVLGDNTLTLEEFCWGATSRFKRGGVGAGVSPLERGHLSILRRFTFKNQHLVNFSPPEETEQSLTPGPTHAATSTPSTDHAQTPGDCAQMPGMENGDVPSRPSKRR